MAGEAAFEVARFVFVPGAALGQAVDHADHLGQEAFRFGLIGHLPQLFDRRAGGFFIITIVQAAFFRLTNAL